MQITPSPFPLVLSCDCPAPLLACPSPPPPPSAIPSLSGAKSNSASRVRLAKSSSPSFQMSLVSFSYSSKVLLRGLLAPPPKLLASVYIKMVFDEIFTQVIYDTPQCLTSVHVPAQGNGLSRQRSVPGLCVPAGAWRESEHQLENRCDLFVFQLFASLRHSYCQIPPRKLGVVSLLPECLLRAVSHFRDRCISRREQSVQEHLI